MLEKEKFIENLKTKGLSAATMKGYKFDLDTFEKFLEEKEEALGLEVMPIYKDFLYATYKPASAMRKLIVANKYLKEVLGLRSEVKPTKIQREYKEFLTVGEFKKIMNQVDKAGDKRTRAAIETLAYTGLRFSELQFVTVEALKEKVININNKGTIRKVPLVDFLIKDLKAYAKNEGIKTGMIFLTRQGNLIDPSYFWKLLKKYTGLARGIKKDKVSAHAFRHLFAKNYLEMDQTNVLDLADILGHKDLATTRIYTQKSIKEHRNVLGNMKKM